MYKIAICGKANTGKNTVSKLIRKEIAKNQKGIFCEYIAFADPIKAMIRIMFPDLPEKYLTSSSHFRSEAIPGAFKDGQPLTVRQLLIDLGTGLGRNYKETIWLENFDNSFKKAVAKNKNMIIVTDVRFRNEFDHMKSQGFFQIRLLRDANIQASAQSNHVSETNQNTIADSEFDYVLDNNGTLKDLKNEVSKIVAQLQP